MHLVFCLCSQVLGGLGDLPGPPGHVVQVEQGVDDEEQVPGVGGGVSHGGDGAQVDREAGQAPELLGNKEVEEVALDLPEGAAMLLRRRIQR